MTDGSFGGYSSEASAAAGEEGPMVMEPLAVEKGQPEKAAALCVEKPVDAISDASDEAPPATEDGDEAPAATDAGDKAVAATDAGDVAPAAREAGDNASRLRQPGAGRGHRGVRGPERHVRREYQAWMRAEYEANDGVVWVDDEFLREQAESVQSLKDLKDEMDDDDDFDFTGWHFEGDPDSPGWNIPRRPSH
uniref:Uncharacterized protein n=1 Tax=Sorghum bicolor TaxID=4558 RepID=Q9XE70_SORBI|nr:hypothetical protein [Sorghum bicolor]